MINPKISYHDLSGLQSLRFGGAIGANAQKLDEAIGGGPSDLAARYFVVRRKEALKKVSTTKIEEAIGTARAVPDKLAELIGKQTVDILRSEQFRREASASLPALERFPRLEERRLAFGARREPPPLGTLNRLSLQVIAGVAIQPPGTEFSLIGTGCMPPIRDQGDRWTCVAFATCAVVEYGFCRTRNTRFDASEQFQYWDTKCNDPDGYNTLGTYPHISFSRVKTDGVCHEQTWPYNMQVDPPQNDPNGPAARPEARQFRVNESVQIQRHRDVQLLKSHVRGDYPVAIAIPVFDSWANNPAVHDSGNIGMPLPGETSEAGHALVLVGYDDDVDFPGGGFFIIRNSYGTSWGAQCPFGAGYGTIPYGYIEQENLSAFIVRL